MEIDTGDHRPIAQRPYSLPLKHRDWVNQELLVLEKAGVITKSISPWASPIVVVPKKSAPGEPPRRRMCVDYRALNELLTNVQKVGSNAKGVLTLIPLPKIDEMYGQLCGAKVFTSLDLRSGYHHISLSPDSQKKSAFVTPMGKYEFKKVPFGLAQAPAYFQYMINTVLDGCEHFALGYLDDILIFSKTPEEHLEHLATIFDRLIAAGLKLKREKCDFLKNQIHYLGHVISEKGIRPIPEKLESIKKMPPPHDVKSVQQFMGLANYYRKFVPHFSNLAKPIVALTRKDAEFRWTDHHQKCFEMIKEMLCDAPVLKYPDPQKPYVLFTDASKYAWGGLLTQVYEYPNGDKTEIVHHPIHYVSGLFKGSQLNWAALTKEAYAIYMSVKKLSFYLTGAKVTLRTDHKPLRKFLLKNTLNNKVNNWAVELEEFQIDVEFLEGKKNTLADTLSRLITLDPSYRNEPELPAEEFGCPFQKLPPLKVQEIKVDKPIADTVYDYTNRIPDADFRKLQQQDDHCLDKFDKLEAGEEIPYRPYFVKNGILHQVMNFGHIRTHVKVAPKRLQPILLKEAHDHGGHTHTFN